MIFFAHFARKTKTILIFASIYMNIIYFLRAEKYFDGSDIKEYTLSMKTIHSSLYSFMRDYHVKDDQLAVKCRSREMRFKEFFKEIDRVAAGLYAMGVRKGDAVMLALPNIIQNVVACYACSRIGAIAAMIHPLYSPDEFETAVKRISPKIVFLSDINLFKFKSRVGGAKVVICPYLAYAFLGLKRGKDFEPYDGDGEEIAFYLQSGGTSGMPKTIALSSRAVNAMVDNLIRFLGDRFNEKNRMLAVMPMFHGFGLCIGVHASLSLNMGCILMARFDVDKCIETIKKERVTTILAIPRMVSKLLASDKFAGDAVTSIEDVYVGGDSVPDELVNAFETRMRASGSNGKLSPGYGLTETVTVCALTKRGDFTEGSLGFPIGDTEAMIVGDDLAPLAAGERGELLLAGSQLMSGYLNDKEATMQTMLTIDGKTWVRTGDIFSMDEEGKLFFVGRKKRLIKISGMNVFPSDIESVARELDYVGEAVALQFDVDGKPYIRLLVEGSLTDDQKEEIIAHITKRLSKWNIPREVVAVANFPRTAVGKLDIKTIEEQYSK